MVAEYTKPLPIPLGRETSQPFWDAARRQELVVPHCTACGRAFFY
ncbi:MAG: zinc ribbon domain-containing protein, partial [Solimonas sp.]